MTDIIFAFLFCALSGMGLGGGGLFSVYLSVICGLPQFLCQGINLLTFVACSLAAVAVNIKKRNVNYTLCIFLSFCACVGAIPGALIASAMPQRMMRIIFGAFLIAAASLSFWEKRK